jgi:hypothetical protein
MGIQEHRDQYHRACDAADSEYDRVFTDATKAYEARVLAIEAETDASLAALAAARKELAAELESAIVSANGNHRDEYSAARSAYDAAVAKLSG